MQADSGPSLLTIEPGASLLGRWPALRRWLALAALCFVSSLIIGSLVGSLSVYAAVIERTERWSAITLGAAGTLLLLCLGLASVVTGYALERFSARRVIAVGILGVATGCWIAASAQLTALFLIGFALIGAGTAAATTVSSIPLITELFNDKRGLGLGLYFAAMSAAAAGLPILVAGLINESGWRAILTATGGAVALSCIVLPIVRGAPAAAEKGENHDAEGLSVADAFHMRKVWSLLAAMICAQLSIQAVLFTTVSYFADGGFPIYKGVEIYGLANLFSVPAVIVAGLLADRLGAKTVMLVGLCIQALGTLALVEVFSAAPVGALAIALFVIGWGVSSSIQMQIGPLLLQDLVGSRHFAAILSYVLSAVGLLAALAPLMASIVGKSSGGYGPLFILCGALSGAAALLAALSRPRTA